MSSLDCNRVICDTYTCAAMARVPETPLVKRYNGSLD